MNRQAGGGGHANTLDPDTHAVPLRTASVMLGLIDKSYENMSGNDRATALYAVYEPVCRWVNANNKERDLSQQVYDALSLLCVLGLYSESGDLQHRAGDFLDPVWTIIRLAKQKLEDAFADPFLYDPDAEVNSAGPRLVVDNTPGGVRP